MGFQFNHVGGGTKTRRPITLHMKYNSGCVQPTCYLMLEDVGEQEVSLEELQVGLYPSTNITAGIQASRAHMPSLAGLAPALCQLCGCASLICPHCCRGWVGIAVPCSTVLTYMRCSHNAGLH